MNELGKRPEFIKMMLIEMVEFNGQTWLGDAERDRARRFCLLFEKVIKTRRDLRVTNPVLFLRSFFGMVFSYYITELFISNSVVQKLMPKNALDNYVEIFLHGIATRSRMNSRLVSIIRKEFIQIMRDRRTLVDHPDHPDHAACSCWATPPPATSATSRWRSSTSAGAPSRAPCWMPTGRRITSAWPILSIRPGIYRPDRSRGRSAPALIIPPDYDTRLAEGKAQVAFILDGSDATAGSHRAVGRHADRPGACHRDAGGAAGTDSGRGSTFQPPLEVRTRVWYNPDLVSSYFMIPGVIGMILYCHHLHPDRHRGRAGARARHHRAADRHPHPPLGTGGRQDPALRHPGLHRHTRGAGHRSLVVRRAGARRPGADPGLFGLLLLSGLGIGLFASTIANTQQEAMLTVWMTLLPSIFLSGFFFPLEAMPKVLQWVSYIVPLRYYLVIIRALLIKGVGVQAPSGARSWRWPSSAWSSWARPPSASASDWIKFSSGESNMQHKRPPLPVIVLVILVLAAGDLLVIDVNADGSGALTASGTIEATTVNVSPEMAGKVNEVLCRRRPACQVRRPLLPWMKPAERAVTVAPERAGVCTRRALLTAQRSYAMAQAQYDATLTAARAQEGKERLADWAGKEPCQFDQPLWYFSREEQMQLGAVSNRCGPGRPPGRSRESGGPQKNGQCRIRRCRDQRFSRRAWLTWSPRPCRIRPRSRAARSGRQDVPVDIPWYAPSAYRIMIDIAKKLSGDSDILTAAENALDQAEAELEDAQNAYDDLLNTDAAEEVLKARAVLSVA